jgi:hypothetical protein
VKDWIQISHSSHLKEDGAQHPTSAHVIGVKHLKVMTCFVTSHKDKITKKIAHKLDLQEYGVKKKWVIITEISKEVGYNNIARVDAYVRQYVSRGVRAGETGTGAPNGDSTPASNAKLNH